MVADNAAALGHLAAGSRVPPDVLFLIGTPDNRAAEFGLAAAGEGYAAFPHRFVQPVVYTVGSSQPRDWPTTESLDLRISAEFTDPCGR